VPVAMSFDLIRYFHRWMLTGISCQPVCRAHRYSSVVAVPDRVDAMAHASTAPPAQSVPASPSGTTHLQH
jgi:hypothetical protein